MMDKVIIGTKKLYSFVMISDVSKRNTKNVKFIHKIKFQGYKLI